MLSFLGGKRGDKGLVGIEASADGIAVAHIVNNPKTGLSLKRCEFIDTTGKGDKAQVLSKKIAEFDLEGIKCNWVLQPANYSLLLIEAPNVPDEEMREAVRWKIKDLISVPVESVVIDVFHLPDDGTRSGKKMIYVVAAEKANVQEKVNLVKGLWLEHLLKKLY